MFMGQEPHSLRTVVQIAGHAYRLGADKLRQEFERGGPLYQLLLHYTHSLIKQIAQTAVCNRYHSIDQQVCRWLLLTLDRMPTLEFRPDTNCSPPMLGVRREGITDSRKIARTPGNSLPVADTLRC